MYFCMYVCMYVCMYACTHARTHARTYVRTYVRMYVKLTLAPHKIKAKKTYFSTKQCAYQEFLGISWFVCVIVACRDMFTLTLTAFIYYHFILKSNIIHNYPIKAGNIPQMTDKHTEY